MRRRFHRRPQETELNITAFMNLMVILVPFLLITAVFSQVTILQLSLPLQNDASTEQDVPRLQLEVILHGDELIVNNALGKPIERIASHEGGFDFKGLSDALYRLKRRYPQHTEIALLLQPETKYDTLIALMDTVRSKMISSGFATSEMELFPDISIGDAPVVTRRGDGR